MVRIAARAALAHLADAAPSVLAGERHHGGRAAAERGDGRTVPVANGRQAVGGALLNVRVAIDSARGDHQASGIDIRDPRQETASRGDCRDLAAVDPQVGQLDSLLGDDSAVPDGQLIPAPCM